MTTSTFPDRWRKEPGARIEGSRPLDRSKVQAPGVVALPGGGFRLFYTAIGPGRPFPTCQGYILSAVSDDGLDFRLEPGIRLAPRPDVPHMSLRVLAPSVTRLADGRWRMYFESRGPATRPTVICSAVSSDLVDWEPEGGIRLAGYDGLGGPRFTPLPGGRGRLYCFAKTIEGVGPDGRPHRSTNVVSAISSDGLTFEFEPGYRMRSRTGEADSSGITAAEAHPPSHGRPWTMYFSAWQDVPPGTVVPPHPSEDPNAEAGGSSEDFAKASIAADMAGYRSRIFVARSDDGLDWDRGPCVVEGASYGSSDIDAVHAEDMSVVELEDGRLRMYYAACDSNGNWRVASAITDGAAAPKEA